IGDNRYFRTEDGALHLDAGPFIRALAYAAGVDPIYLGKPAPAFFQMACETMGLPPGEVLMIGDDVEADILGALNAGLKAALVKTGKYQPGDENKLTGHTAGIGESLFS
ncbi:MAG TPA: TIGR01458 family HAD-type hydrolase, partial [Gammaproteobacteria bacterium]|nr:TIGR01458 family HAD-type hydrolase [Gammaproteobacteria bacterium]